MRVFVDTNVLVYAYDTTEAAKRERAREVLASLAPDELVLSSQVLNEFYVVVTRAGQELLTRAEAGSIVARFAAAGVEPVDGDLVQRALRVHQEEEISYWDALIVAAAARRGCVRVLSEDLTHASVLAGVEIVDPFR
jgi:predicted nucleic acid-binding protein